MCGRREDVSKIWSGRNVDDHLTSDDDNSDDDYNDKKVVHKKSLIIFASKYQRNASYTYVVEDWTQNALIMENCCFNLI